MINKKWCDPRNISILSRSCSPHLEHLSIICRPFYLPREFSAVIATAVYIPPQADTSLALSKLHEELSGYINKHPDAASIIAGDLTKPTSGRSCPNFHQHVSCPTRGPIHWIIATLSSRMPIKLVPYQPSGSQTTRPFSSHRNINKGSFRIPGEEGSDAAGPPTLKLCYRRLLMTSTGTWFRVSSADVSEFTDVALSFVNMLTDQATETVTIRTFSNQKTVGGQNNPGCG